jgi:thiamine monophosphate synthase
LGTNDEDRSETIEQGAAANMKGSKHGTKVKKFVQRLREAQANGVTLIVIREPQELGETYEEVVESLNRLAELDLNLAVLPEEARDR